MVFHCKSRSGIQKHQKLSSGNFQYIAQLLPDSDHPMQFSLSGMRQMMSHSFPSVLPIQYSGVNITSPRPKLQQEAQDCGKSLWWWRPPNSTTGCL